MEIIYAVLGLVIGILIGVLWGKSKLTSLSSKLEEKDNYLSIKDQEIFTLKEENKINREEILNLTKLLSESETNIKNLNERIIENNKQVNELENKFQIGFENLANKIFDDKSQRFTQQNKENLATILNPLKDKISEFEKKVENAYLNESNQRAALSQELKNLHELNKQMSSETENLTKALKGDSKFQGNWGEFILESVLDKSGLVKGREYLVQETIKNEEGNFLRPDVIVKLPDNKSIIIDSKVSLKAYEQYCSEDIETEKIIYLNEHIASIRRHLKNLSPKEYQTIYGVNNLDFVLMFIPIEPAFALAMQNDKNLFYDAFEKNIIIVSPTTLLATLRTISSIWKQEKQTKNALDIAKKGGELYDKLSAFVEDLIKVGTRMDDAKKSYEDAMKKLADGRGNIISRAENLKLMGAKATKSIDQRIVDRSIDDIENDDTELKLLP